MLKTTRIMAAMFFFSVLTGSCSKDESEDPDDFSGNTGSFVDERDGHQYKWVKIGDQVWMAENLAYLPGIRQNFDGSSKTEARYFVYDYEGSSVYDAKATDNYKTYGVLYNWPAAVAASPKGWHLPGDEEWRQLGMFISGLKGMNQANDDGWDEVGKFLKTKTGWEENSNGTDEFGFSGQASGHSSERGYFSNLGESNGWWSTTQYGINYVWVWQLSSYGDGFWRNYLPVDFGYSIRCVKD